MEGAAMEKEIIQENAKTAHRPSEKTPPAVRYASDEQFKKAHEKINKAHAGLFRRLAQ
jgi:hypothetical protein